MEEVGSAAALEDVGVGVLEDGAGRADGASVVSEPPFPLLE
jgi:hypothetical protein